MNWMLVGVFAYILFAGTLVSAILSTVDSTLLAAHNFVVSLKPGLPDRKKLLLARAGGAVFGVVAYGLARGAESTFELVQQANGIGSAGVLVLVVFGLFSGRGGAWAGYATLVAGLGVWARGTWIGGWPCPYLLSLIAALGAFVSVGLWEGRTARFSGER